MASPRPYLSRIFAAIVLFLLAELPRITTSRADMGSAGLHPVHTPRTLAVTRCASGAWRQSVRYGGLI